jgi:hypothetical protein
VSAYQFEPGMPPIMEFFSSKHLPVNLQNVAGPFENLAKMMVQQLPACDELHTGLRKLLEAKDCAVRAAIGSRVPVAMLAAPPPR